MTVRTFHELLWIDSKILFFADIGARWWWDVFEWCRVNFISRCKFFKASRNAKLIAFVFQASPCDDGDVKDGTIEDYYDDDDDEDESHPCGCDFCFTYNINSDRHCNECVCEQCVDWWYVWVYAFVYENKFLWFKNCFFYLAIVSFEAYVHNMCACVCVCVCVYFQIIFRFT